ncbi:MAG: glycosyltransferase, partial [Myxococcota bacterium]
MAKIVVITGMEVHPFDRLLRAIDELVDQGTLKDEVFIQRGHTPYEPKHVEWEAFISFGDLCARVEACDVVITHAGAGSTLTCLQCRKKPIAVPRRAEFGEHIDDHQRPFSQKLHDFGLARQVIEM